MRENWAGVLGVSARMRWLCQGRFAAPHRADLRERLPGIRIPLREQDDDVALDLQSLVDRAYLTGAYDDLDYKREAEPPLGAEDAAWADRLLREKKLRD